MGRGDSQAICTSLTESQWQPSPPHQLPSSLCSPILPSIFVCIIVYPYHPVRLSLSLLFVFLFSLHYSVCQFRCASRSQTKPGDREDLEITLMWDCVSVSQGCHYQLASLSVHYYYYHISFLLCHWTLLRLMLLLFPNYTKLNTVSPTTNFCLFGSKGQRSGMTTELQYSTAAWRWTGVHCPTQGHFSNG